MVLLLNRVPKLKQNFGQLQIFLVAVGLAFGAYGIGVLLVLVVGTILQVGGIPAFENKALMIGLSTVLLQGIAFGGVALGFLSLSDRSYDFLQIRIPTVRDGVVAIAGCLLLFGLFAAVSQFLTFLGIPIAENNISKIGEQSPIVFLLLVPLSYLLVGPGEELLYRGLIQRLFSEEFHSARAIVLASSLFAFVHVFSLSGEGIFGYILIVFLLATVLGSTYYYTDNLVVPAFIHATYNAVQFGAAYLAATGTSF